MWPRLPLAPNGLVFLLCGVAVPGPQVLRRNDYGYSAPADGVFPWAQSLIVYEATARAISYFQTCRRVIWVRAQTTLEGNMQNN